jgi:hypothetical protein
MEDIDGKASVLYVWYGMFFLSARSFQSSEFAKNARRNSSYSAIDYAFSVVLSVVYF